MRLPHILCLIFIFTAIYHNQALTQQFTLPDLGINNVAPTCQNAGALLTAAQSDSSRVQGFTQNEIPNSINTVQNTISQLQQVCSVKLNTAPSALLQAQASNSKLRSSASASSSSSSKLTSSLEEASRQLKSREDKSQLYDDLIADKAEELSKQVLIMSRQSASTCDSQGFGVVCANAQASAQYLLDYLNFLNTQITQQTLAIDLPQRIATLQALQADCVAPATQTGSYVTKYIETNHIMQQANQNKVRNDDINITFPVPFVTLPSVGVMPYAVDLDQSEQSVQLSVLNVSLTGFTLRITALPNIRIYNCYVNYIATVSEKSGIYIINHSVDQSTDPAVQTAFKNRQPVTKSLTIPANLPNLQLAAFIQGFDFSGSNYPRLNVNANATAQTITYQTWSDTVIKSAAATVLCWSGNDKSIMTRSVSSTYNGPLTQNSGARQETPSFTTPGYLSTPVSVFGLWYLDVATGFNFRLHQSLTGSPSGWTLTIADWDNTRIYQIQDTAFFTCPTIDESKCFSG